MLENVLECLTFLRTSGMSEEVIGGLSLTGLFITYHIVMKQRSETMRDLAAVIRMSGNADKKSFMGFIKDLLRYD